MTFAPATRHPYHFKDLSPADFERLVYWLVKRSDEFDQVQWYGGVRDKGRDVVAYKHTPTSREKWYIQCKRYQTITFATLRDELDKLAQHAENEPSFVPHAIVFATSCSVSPQAKDQAAAYASQARLPELYYWGRLELDEYLKAQPDTEREFFDRSASSSVPTGIPARRPLYAIIGLFVGAVVDLLINLVAAAIQQRTFADQFSTATLYWLVGLSVAGLLLGHWLGAGLSLQMPTPSRPRAVNNSQPITITRLRALLSYAKLRGKGIDLADILLIGSCLDIETTSETKD